MSQAQAGQATTLQELLRRAINHELTEFHVCMPGRIELYNPTTGTATIKPTISRRFRGAEEPVEYPVIPRVPIIQPRTAQAKVTFPIKTGDAVILVFADRNIENWDASNGSEIRETLDVRRHDLSDAFAILGGYPSLNPALPRFPDALNIEVIPGVKIALSNGTGAVELLDLFDQTMALMDTILTNVQALTVGSIEPGAGTSGVPANAADFAANSASLNLIKSKLGQLKA